MKYRFAFLFCVGLILIFSLTSLFGVSAQTTSVAASELKIAYVSNESGNNDIWLMPASGGAAINLTSNAADDNDPAWSPKGDQIAFVSNRDGSPHIYVMSASGSRVLPLISDVTDNTDVAPAWSPDGKQIAFISDRGGLGRDLFIIDTQGQNLTRLTNNGFIKGDPAWSPDGLWLAYWERQRDGEIHIFKLNLETKKVQRLSNKGPNNGMPVWSPDGQSIDFDSDRDGDWGVYRMSQDGAKPERLTPADSNSGRASFAPDGSRIVFVTDRDQSDELYLMNADGKNVERLTDNAASDFAPVWQPAQPAGEQAVVAVVPTIAVTPTPDLEAAAVAQSAGTFNNQETSVIPLDFLNADYGFQLWHQQGWTGKGRKVAVIDLEFGGLQDFETREKTEVTINPSDDRAAYQNDVGTHGTEVLEVIHSVAPDAELYACRYDGLLKSLIDCTEWLRKAKVNVINHSAGLPVYPLDGTNDWAQLVEKLYQEGILWINSAGNFNKGFLSENFTDTDNDNLHDFTVGQRTDKTLRFKVAPYSGNILLTWQPQQQYNYETGQQQTVDLDLQIIRLSDETVIASSERKQREDSTIQTAENVYLNTSEPWGIRILNVGQPMEANADSPTVPFSLFVEFASIEGRELNDTGSVIAPGDAPNALTVGSVQGITNQLAGYSSRGVRGVGYIKPDLSAPGELRLSNGENFIGTSAAAPVVSGAAALVWQANPNALADDVRLYLMRSLMSKNDINYGQGILKLHQPELVNLDVIQNVAVRPKTVFFKEAATVDNTIKACAGAMPPRLAVDAQGYVNYNLGLGIRAKPATNAAKLANFFLGTQFTVIGGPVCDGGENWWQVELTVNEQSAGTGWFAEGNKYYLIAPRLLVRAQLPGPFTEECPLAPPTELAVGERATITNAPAGGLSIWRSTGGKNLIAGLGQGTELYILGGPVCEGNSKSIRRWYVRVMDGQWQGNEGWTSEAKTGTRWLNLK